jgi:hypothetical protein
MRPSYRWPHFLAGGAMDFKTSKIKATAIKEAVEAWSSSNTSTCKGRCKFGEKIIKLGWKKICSDAAFKSCYFKDSIIIKFARNPGDINSCNEVTREVQQWKMAPRNFKKHIPKIYTYIDGLIVQDRVMLECESYVKCKKARDVANKFNYLSDWKHNHGHSKKGTVKFFDWVYRRNWNKSDDIEIDFLK